MVSQILETEVLSRQITKVVKQCPFPNQLSPVFSWNRCCHRMHSR